MGFLGGSAWGTSGFFHQLNPRWFLQPEVVDSYLHGNGTLGWGAWCGAGTPRCGDILLNVYPLHVGEGTARSESVPLLAVWMDAVSLIL